MKVRGIKWDYRTKTTVLNREKVKDAIVKAVDAVLHKGVSFAEASAGVKAKVVCPNATVPKQLQGLDNKKLMWRSRGTSAE